MKIKKILSKLLVEQKMEDYFHMLKSYDKEYILNKNPSAYANGQKVENDLKTIYASLTDEAKFQSALAFKNFYQKKYGNVLQSWNPQNPYDLKKFDGYNVIGLTDKK